ncbi:MAG: hypothetical protein EOP85_10935 [Verrucomicrobiaceae bacterium]|nr:MAG: hypothetical protein EOP85_10935 [Verrucomicrobiaceae bacterium]
MTKNVNAATITNSGASDSTLTTTGTTTFAGVIQNGATHKTLQNVGSGALTLSGANSFTGKVTVSGGLTLADNGQLLFTPGPNTLVNSINGAGSLTLDGDFVIETAGASVANGNTWTLVNVDTLSEAFGATFSVVDFTQNANVWTQVDGNNNLDLQRGHRHADAHRRICVQLRRVGGFQGAHWGQQRCLRGRLTRRHLQRLGIRPWWKSARFGPAHAANPHHHQ